MNRSFLRYCSRNAIRKTTDPLVFVWMLLVSSGGFSQTPILDLLQNKQLDCTVTGSWSVSDKESYYDADGQYFGKCMTVTLRNRTKEFLNITIDNGLMLLCEDTNVQDMLITKPMYVKLEPQARQTFELYAMCSEIHDAMPTRSTRYRFGKAVDPQLTKIAKAIDSLMMHNVAGQGAVWAYRDQATEDDLRRYGATDATLRITALVLNSAGAQTKINPPAEPEPEKKAAPVRVPKKPVAREAGIFVPIYLIWIVCGSAVILLLVTAWSLRKAAMAKRQNPQA